jgi:hypothetical protein
MKRVSCHSCGTVIDEAEALFAADGMICSTCHARSEAAAGAFDDDNSGFPGLDASPLTRTRATQHRRDDGTVVTHISETSVDLGPLNSIIRLVRRLFARGSD